MDRSIASETTCISDFWATGLRDDDFEKFPKFIKVLSHLKDYISPEGTSCKLAKLLKEASALLKAAKSSYLKMVTIYDIIISEINCLDKLDSKSAMPHSKMKEILVAKEVQQKLACLQVKEIGPAKSEHGLLGLDLLLSSKSTTTFSDDDVKSLQNIVHIQLEAYCREMTQLYKRMTDAAKGDNHQFPNGKLSTEQCQLFSAIVEIKRKELDANNEKLESAKQMKQRLILKFYKTLNSSVQSMMDIGELCSCNNYSSREAEVMIVTSEVLLLKIRSLRLRLMTEIYDENSVKAHLKIKECLDNATTKLQSDKVLTEHRLAAYESVGSQFHTLLNEYVDITTKIKQKVWMLNMLSGAIQSDKE